MRPLLQHDDLVGIDHRRQPVADDDRGAPGARAGADARGCASRCRCRPRDSASSSSSSGASVSSARAIATRWRCPPDSVTPRSPTGRVVAVRQAADVVVQVGQLRGACRSRLRVASLRASAMFSAIVAENRNGSCGTHAIAAAQRGQRVVGRGARRPRGSRPAAARSGAAASCSSVDLPAPVGPTTPSVCPGRSSLQRRLRSSARLDLARIGEARPRRNTSGPECDAPARVP